MPDCVPSPRRLPPWLKISLKGAEEREGVRQLLADLHLNTVCESAMCPNLCECWAKRTATFMILGKACTRNCRFCAVPHGPRALPDADEPERVAEAAVRLNLKFVVLTSVTRDDLPDGGAAHFAATLRAIQQRLPAAGIEVLVPDFLGDAQAIDTVLAANPTVFNHNVETCERLTPQIRDRADYRRSLAVLSTAVRLRAERRIVVKSGIMVGLGETWDEILVTLRDIRQAGADMITIGQYLAPSRQHVPVDRFLTPDEFAELGRIARDDIGFEAVASAPFVRSSYMAETHAHQLLAT